MAGDFSKGEPGGTRPLRIRPHWWAVLAVSLSLLALVAATRSGRTVAHPHNDAAARSTGGHTTPVTTHAPGSTTTTVPDPTSASSSVSPPAATPAVATVTLPTVGPKIQIVTRPSTTASTVPTTTTTPTTTTPSGSSVGAAPAQPAPKIVDGDLQQPDDATNSFTFVGAGAMQVTATWPTSPTLSLTVDCPEGTKTAQGSMSVTVLLSDADGTCAVTLKELLVQDDLVSYRVTIAPAGG
jgi:hypothetical protein